MAVKTSVKQLSKALSTAVQDLANSQGWARNEYAVIAMYHLEHETTFLIVGSTQPVNRVECTQILVDNLAIAFGSRSAAIMYVVPVVRHFEHLDQIYKHLNLGDQEIDISDML